MVDRSRLRQFMIESFNDDELADLVFDYFPNARGSLGEGMTLGQKVRTLIDFTDRHDRLDHLVVVVERLRPEAYCNFFQTDLDLPPEPATAARDPNKLFISYANPDADFAIRLAADLRQRGFDVWMAPDSILPGEKWVAAIERGLRESGIFLLVLTPAGVDSKWVSQETQVAIMLENEGQMRIFPLRVRRAEVPLLLSTRQHIAFDMDYDRGLAGLLAALRPGQKPSGPPPPAFAPPPRPAVTATLLVTDLPVPVLIVDRPDTLTQEFPLIKAALTVGRAPDNDIVLTLPIVSSHHLLLEAEDTGEMIRVWLTDLGSRNGTFLGGRRLTPNARQPLEPGDMVNLGDRAGRAVSLILRPPPSKTVPPIAAYRPMVAKPAVAGHKPPVATPPVAVYQPPAARPPVVGRAISVPPVPPTPLNGSVSPAAAPSSALSRVPIWAYAVAGLVLVALLTFFALRGRGEDERPATTNTAPVVTNAVVAAADQSLTATTAATSAAKAPPPTTPPTVAPTATTESPTVEPTEAAAPEETATPEPTAAPTELPTSAAALPTEAPNFAISRDTPLSFEAAGDWLRDDRDSRSAGEIAISAEQARSGSHSLRLAYEFSGSADDYVIFLAPRAFRIANDRERRFLKVWVLGDGATLNLSAIIEDDEGELWKVYMGEISSTEWQQLDGYIGDMTWPSGVYGNAGNGQVDFPVRLRGLHLDDVTSSFAGAGAVYLDDLTVE